MKNKHPGAQVVELACRRFEDALGEGALGPSQLEHARQCGGCRRLAADLEATLAAIRSVTAGPAALPAGFAAGVLGRADELARQPRRSQERFRGFAAGIAMAALGAAAYWLGAGRDAAPNPADFSPAPVAVGAAPAPGPVLAPMPAPRRASLPAAEPPTPDAAQRPAYTVPPSEAVPEPAVDLPRELVAMLRDHVRLQKDCPAHTTRPITVRLTLTREGQLVNRTVYSEGADRHAHDCVAAALVRIVLPPLPSEREISVDVSW